MDFTTWLPKVKQPAAIAWVSAHQHLSEKDRLTAWLAELAQTKSVDHAFLVELAHCAIRIVKDDCSCLGLYSEAKALFEISPGDVLSGKAESLAFNAQVAAEIAAERAREDECSDPDDDEEESGPEEDAAHDVAWVAAELEGLISVINGEQPESLVEATLGSFFDIVRHSLSGDMQKAFLSVYHDLTALPNRTTTEA